jgi:pectinesterase
MTDSEIYEVNPNASAALWHDGSRDRDMKFVLRSCRFDGVDGWRFARHHADAQFFLLDCTFSAAMRDLAPYRVVYPTNGGLPTDADKKRNRELDPVNQWGERSYFYNCHRTGGDYPWHADNLSSVTGAPSPAQITAKWTFAGKWDPENKSGPVIAKTSVSEKRLTVTFAEAVTVKGPLRLALSDGTFGAYSDGSGSTELTFTVPAAIRLPQKLDFIDGAIIANEASSSVRWLGRAIAR